MGYRLVGSVLAAGVLLGAVTVFAQDPPVPDPVSLIRPGGTGLPVETPGERAQRQSDQFSTASDAALAEAQASFNEFHLEGRRVAQAEAQAAEARRKRVRLVSERENALAELRQGLYCSGCNKTRSQILALGEQFPHPGQQVIVKGATPDQLAAKAREFDSAIQAMQLDEARALQQRDLSAFAQRMAAQEVMKGYVVWKDAMVAEDKARAAAWDSAIATYKRRFAAGMAAIRKLDEEIARAGELSDVSGLERQRWFARDVMKTLTKDVEQDYFRRAMDLAQFNDRLAKGRDTVEHYVREVGGPPLSMTRFLPTTPDIPVGPVSLSMSPDAIGFSVSLGEFKARLRVSEDWLRSELKIDMTLGLDGLEAGMSKTCGTVGCADKPLLVTPPVIRGPDPLELLQVPPRR